MQLQDSAAVPPSLLSESYRFEHTSGSTHTRRRVNPDSLAVRLGPELIKELESLLVPGSTEMPPFAARQEIQKRYNIDRRHIYDWYHTKGLRVSSRESGERVEKTTVDCRDLRPRIKVTNGPFYLNHAHILIWPIEICCIFHRGSSNPPWILSKNPLRLHILTLALPARIYLLFPLHPLDILAVLLGTTQALISQDSLCNVSLTRPLIGTLLSHLQSYSALRQPQAVQTIPSPALLHRNSL